MKIATFNVNSIRSRVDLIMTWLKEKDAIDVLCMQELKCVDEEFPYEAFEKENYHVAINGEKQYNGVAICSKLPFERVKTEFNNQILDMQKRLIEVQIKDILILNVYIPHGSSDESDEKHKFKMDFYDALRDYILSCQERYNKIILVGDFNVALEDIDVYKPKLFKNKVGFLQSEKLKFKSLLNIGLHDCYREKNPQIQAFTWWDYRTAGIWRDEGMRIDYILGTKFLVDLCQNIEVDIWTRRRRIPTPSDHAPLVGELKNF